MVIASSSWIHNVQTVNQSKSMFSTIILICHDNSYPFQERTVSLEQPIKIGRSVARARAANDNAIFDCKVLSRNHALLWYDSGKFYLKDTKSSNGTFVNNKRLSPSGEESIACEVCSGDVVQFGVDVVESTKKVTHGCIVATLKLYLPDGKEAKASFTNSITYVNVTLEDLYKLHQFIQEAGRRENALRSKLDYMQQLLEHTRVAINQSWKALVLEDCLLSRLEMLENQVLAYSKNYHEDNLRTESIDLIEDKTQYQIATKELLQKKIQEKREIVTKIQILKSRLSESEGETYNLRSIIKNNQNELQDLAVKYVKIQQTLQDTTDKLNKTNTHLKEMIQQSEEDKKDYIQKIKDHETTEKDLKLNLKDSKLDSIYIYKQMNALKNYILTVQDTKFANSGICDFCNYAKPVDIVSMILSKWNSIYIEILKNESMKNEKHEICLTEKIEMLNSVCLKNNLKKSDLFHNFTVLENNQKFILLSEPDKKMVLTNRMLNSEKEHKYDLNDISSEIKKKTFLFEDKNRLNRNVEIFSLKDTTRSTNKNFDCTDTNPKSKNKLLTINFSKMENKTLDNVDRRYINEFQTDHFESRMFHKTLSKKIVKVTEEVDAVRTVKEEQIHIEKMQDTLVNRDQIMLKTSNLPKRYLTHTLKSSICHDIINSKSCLNSILQNLISRFKYSQNDCFYQNQNVNQDLQDLKTWLMHESNEAIINKLEKYYCKIENETQQMLELKEQLVILKEKYNTIAEEKSDIKKRCVALEHQCEKFSNASHVIPVYYIIPILFLLLWMLLEKLL